jgi:hypothetical protein
MSFRLFFSVLLLPLLIRAQQRPSQTIKGTVTERSIRTPLAGATVEVMDLDRQAVTDATGGFRLNSVPVGRRTLRVTCKGFRTATLSNLLLESGKELVLNIEMEEEVVTQQEILIQGRANKTRPLNEMASVSARMFSVEETRRFAAGLNDPSRIATAFAGVQSQGDANALVIRGNAPNGLLWRMEGIDIPNPNHFARVGTSGGAISILSAQLLANSDFMTGAFPAEYGNALSGVFDIRLRKGNKDKREHTFSVSTIGVDGATEGYFKKGHGASYLVNYRYGFLTLMQKIGFNIGDAATSFQDLSFHVHLPAGKAGSFSIFGFGGISEQRQEVSRDSMDWVTGKAQRSGWVDGARTGAVGISHSLNIGRKTLLKTVYSLNGYAYREEDNRLDKFNGPLIVTRDNLFRETNGVMSLTVTHKFNSRHLLKAGAYSAGKHFDLQQKEWVVNALRDKVKAEGNTRLTNVFTQWKWTPTNRLSFITGLHGQQFALNRSSALEPRLGLRWVAGQGRSLTMGIGRHSQIQPLGNYFARIKVGNDSVEPNRDMGLSRADHYVIGYAHQFAGNWNFKVEGYYQRLHNIPISATRQSNFSMINQDDDYVIEPLANKGKGRNFGLELTLERFWNDQFYFLSTLSLYQSKYLPSDGILRNTRYNSNNCFTLLMGKEWSLNGKRSSTFSVDIKMVAAGGIRVTPIDLPRSIALKRTVLETWNLYGDKLPAYSRIDLQGEWRIQYGRRTGSFILGVQNLLNHKNPYRQTYDPVTQSIKYSYLLGLIPVAGYKVDF